MLDHDLLKTFTAVVDCGSFSRAAELVHRTPSAVSMQVKRLEDQVGSLLFTRTAEGASLTAAGELLLIHALKILNAHEAAIDALDRARSGEKVRVGIPEEYVATLMPKVVAWAASQEQPVGVQVVCEASHRLKRRLDEASVDLAVVTELQAGDERGDVLRSERALWVCGTGDRTCREDPLPLAADAEGCVFRRAALTALADQGRRHRLAVVGSHPVVKTAVLAGGVVGLVPESALCDGMRELSTGEGFAQLPPAVLRLRTARNPRSPWTGALRNALLSER